MWADSPDCAACASGWHTRCRWPEQADDGDWELVERCCDGVDDRPPPPTPVDPLMLATLVGLSMLLALVGGTATLAGALLARQLRAREVRRHPERAVARQRGQYGRRITAEWPLLAQTLRPRTSAFTPGQSPTGSWRPIGPRPTCSICHRATRWPGVGSAAGSACTILTVTDNRE
jgi:hypothetical protein